MSPTKSATRTFPEKTNPLILPDASPDYEELLSRRRLGKTNLSVKAAQVGITNATKPENLGVFEYAHLRAPLPKDLSGSEIFTQHHGQQHTETYFLMRRSKDGFVSATGMFKIAFPWAKVSEEKAERDYLKSMPDTSQDEVANNVWVSPELALELAKEYNMIHWVRALLDSSEIVQTPASDKKLISPPPKFEMPPLDAAALLPPPTTRGRARRSASPTKFPSPKKSTTQTRKGRQTKAMKEANAANATAANESLQSALDSAASAAKSEEKSEEKFEEKAEENAEEEAEEPVTNGERDEQVTNGIEKAENEEAEEETQDSSEKVKVDVQTTVDNTEHTEKTDVSVEMPVGLPELPIPEDTEDMIAKAKEMVAEANKLQEAEASTSSPKESKKRKTDVSIEDGESADATDTPAQPAKKAKILEDRLRRERVRNRALVGVSAAIAVAAAVPYFF